MTPEKQKAFIDFARTSQAFEVSIYHLRLDPQECVEASRAFRRLADKIDAGLKKGGYVRDNATLGADGGMDDAPRGG